MSALVYFFREEARITDVIKRLGLGPEKMSEQQQVVPIKLHMGEPGNPNFVRPAFVSRIAAYLRALEKKPVLWDTTVAYSSPRSTAEGYYKVAKNHGFTDVCDVRIEDKGYVVNIDNYDIEVALILRDIKFFIVVSHVKGHVQAGFGGAIKNLGMGCVTKATKKMIHEAAKPKYIGAKCTLCGKCAEACPFGAIVVERCWAYYPHRCFGCGICVEGCPTNALGYVGMNFLKGLALAARAVMLGRDALFINVLKNIAAHCDCDPNSGPIICKNIGYLASTDAVAVDAASLHLIRQACGKKVFEDVNMVDPEPILRFGQELGLGTARFALVEVR